VPDPSISRMPSSPVPGKLGNHAAACEVTGGRVSVRLQKHTRIMAVPVTPESSWTSVSRGGSDEEHGGQG